MERLYDKPHLSFRLPVASVPAHDTGPHGDADPTGPPSWLASVLGALLADAGDVQGQLLEVPGARWMQVVVSTSRGCTTHGDMNTVHSLAACGVVNACAVDRRRLAGAAGATAGSAAGAASRCRQRMGRVACGRIVAQHV